MSRSCCTTGRPPPITLRLRRTLHRKLRERYGENYGEDYQNSERTPVYNRRTTCRRTWPHRRWCGLQYPQTKEARPDCPHRRRQRRSLGNQREIISSVTTDEFVLNLASTACLRFCPTPERMPEKKNVPQKIRGQSGGQSDTYLSPMTCSATPLRYAACS